MARMGAGGDGPLTAQQFVEKWRGRELSERASSQVHFVELCRLLGVPYPHQNPADDGVYCFDAVTATPGSRMYAATKRGKRAQAEDDRGGLFGEEVDGSERPAPLTAGTLITPAPTEGRGFADVWKKDFFCWEYKRQGKHADLAAALRQLKEYKDSLFNPPLLIVCDIDRFEIHTNFTGHPVEVYAFGLGDLAVAPKEWSDRGVSPLQALRYAFTDPEWFRPKKTVNAITEELAEKIGDLAIAISDRKRDDDGTKNDPHDVAHFMMQLVFAMFAEDVDLLPRSLVSEIIRRNTQDPKRFTSQMRTLFERMATGGDFGADRIEWFNGGLFSGVDAQRIPRMTTGEIGSLSIVSDADWSAIEPSILGTLFERSLDPAKRAQIGAHYTSREDILLIVEPVVMAPLRREWEEAQAAVAKLVERGGKDAKKKIEARLRGFHERLREATILDPACGSGNFLYVSIQRLLDLEKEVITFASRTEIGVRLEQRVSPTQLRGLEINPYAAELARVSVWIGYLKWRRENGMTDDGRRPLLDPLETIREQDAILDRTGKKARVPGWPEAEFIVGNPPFLGSKLFRKWGLSDDYLEDLYASYDLPNTSDLCCYWFEQARRAIERHPDTRVGLLATQGIRGGDNRTVLERIKETGDIFMAWSDRKWILDGAAVHVSIVGFDDGTESALRLDDRAVPTINADLSDGVGTTSAQPLPENTEIAFMGDTKGGAFDIEWTEAAALLATVNPHRHSNAAVVVPWMNGVDVTRRQRAMFIVDFGVARAEADAARFEAPFRLLEERVLPERRANRRAAYRERWWIHVEPRPAMREQLRGLSRYVVTPLLTKHRLFAWLAPPTLPDHQLIVFARSDDYFLGVLHSAVHELWARRMGTQLREAESGFRYTPTTCFETFPLPWAPGEEPERAGAKGHALWRAIGDAAEELNALRERWLNPAEWIGEVERKVDIAYREEIAAVPAGARDLVRRSAVMAEAAKDKRLKKRTLTNLYNERPAWLRMAHRKLDEAVLRAYAAVDPEGGWDPAWAAVYEPFGAGEISIKGEGARRGSSSSSSSKGKWARKAAQADPDADAKRAAIAARGPVDERILGALLRLNRERAGVGEGKGKKKGKGKQVARVSRAK